MEPRIISCLRLIRISAFRVSRPAKGPHPASYTLSTRGFFQDVQLTAHLQIMQKLGMCISTSTPTCDNVAIKHKMSITCVVACCRFTPVLFPLASAVLKDTLG
jgi:hypothetical protein